MLWVVPGTQEDSHSMNECWRINEWMNEWWIFITDLVIISGILHNLILSLNQSFSLSTCKLNVTSLFRNILKEIRLLNERFWNSACVHIIKSPHHKFVCLDSKFTKWCKSSLPLPPASTIPCLTTHIHVVKNQCGSNIFPLDETV